MFFRSKPVLRNEKGFTLIEVIAVLVLIGILAAVAVPRYVDLTTKARANSLNALVAELKARANMNFANNRLNGTSNFILDVGDLYDLGGPNDFADFKLDPVIDSSTVTWTGTTGTDFDGMSITVSTTENAAAPAVITHSGF